jgi:hypothetical protein
LRISFTTTYSQFTLVHLSHITCILQYSRFDIEALRIITVAKPPHSFTNTKNTSKMRSVQQVVLFFFALFALAFAQESEDGYDATVYITSTVYRVNTVTASSVAGYTPVNQTSTISATHPTIIPSYNAGNASSAVLPTGSASLPSNSQAAPSTSSPAQFEGAASSLNINTFVVALAAGVGYLVL